MGSTSCTIKSKLTSGFNLLAEALHHVEVATAGESHRKKLQKAYDMLVQNSIWRDDIICRATLTAVWPSSFYIHGGDLHSNFFTGSRCQSCGELLSSHDLRALTTIVDSLRAVVLVCHLLLMEYSRTTEGAGTRTCLATICTNISKNRNIISRTCIRAVMLLRSIAYSLVLASKGTRVSNQNNSMDDQERHWSVRLPEPSAQVLKWKNDDIAIMLDESYNVESLLEAYSSVPETTEDASLDSSTSFKKENSEVSDNLEDGYFPLYLISSKALIKEEERLLQIALPPLANKRKYEETHRQRKTKSRRNSKPKQFFSDPSNSKGEKSNGFLPALCCCGNLKNSSKISTTSCRSVVLEDTFLLVGNDNLKLKIRASLLQAGLVLIKILPPSSSGIISPTRFDVPEHTNANNSKITFVIDSRTQCYPVVKENVRTFHFCLNMLRVVDHSNDLDLKDRIFFFSESCDGGNSCADNVKNDTEGSRSKFVLAIDEQSGGEFTTGFHWVQMITQMVLDAKAYREMSNDICSEWGLH
mmetsp:Transcript_39091/g.76221  ORF Transcript_39091/g.76221 Transcript_39091/m.76221 type:complete len:528 (+) Transcript_39091:88-1671(+)